jgi:hypothetical protein
MTDTACLYTTGSLSFGTAGFSGAAGSHPGRCRQNNEDRYELDPQAAFMLVVDGIGGNAAGDVAAGLAADAIRRRMRVWMRQRSIVFATPFSWPTNASWNGRRSIRS